MTTLLTENRLRLSLNLTPVESQIVAMLWRSRSGWLSRERLEPYTRCPGRDHTLPPRQLVAVRVHICNIRKKIGRDAILNEPGDGYRLGERGVKLCREAMR